MFNLTHIVGGFIKLLGGTDKTPIGNAQDALKVNLRTSSGQEAGTTSNPLSVNIAGGVTLDVNLDGFSASNPDSVQTTGSIDGTKTGTKYGIVYNRRQQILAAHDRTELYTYADFGTINQRITRIDYTSATFPGIIVRRDFNYVLDGNRYKRTSSPWTVI